MKPPVVLPTFLLCCAGNLWSVCPALGIGQRLRANIPPRGLACATLLLRNGEAARISLPQPQDLSIELTSSGETAVIDSFEFGEETITIAAAGEYRINVRPVVPSRVAVTFTMQCATLVLQEAPKFQQAERAATRSKQTGEPADIAASLQLWRDLNDIASIARTHLKQAEHDFNRDDAAARASYEAALELCHRIHDTYCIGDAATNSGITARRFGDFRGAYDHLQEAVTVWRQLSRPVEEAQALSNLGVLLRQTGDLRRAISSYDRAEVVLRGKDPVAHARVINNLGLCYLDLAEYETAELHFRRALAVFVRERSKGDEVRALLNHGRSHLMLSRLGLARQTLEQALKKADRDDGARADILNNLGQTLLRLHNTEAAESRLHDALELDRGRGDKRGIAFDQYYLGMAAQSRGAIGEARGLFKEALAIRRECGLRDDVTESLFALASLENGAGNRPEARSLAEESLRLLESVRSQIPGAALRASYYSRKRRIFDLLVEISADRANPTAARDSLLAAERGRGRALLDLIAGGALLHQVPPALALRRSEIQNSLQLLSVQLGNAGSPGGAELREQVRMLIANDENVEARIRDSVQELPLARQLESVEQVQQALPHGTALLEYHLAELRSYLWLVDRERVLVFELPPRAKVNQQARETARLFADWKGRRLNPGLKVPLRASLAKLSAILVGELRGVKLPQRLIFVADGELYRIPFAALSLPGEAGQLGLTHDLLQAPAASYLVAGRELRPRSTFPKTILALADPVFASGGLARLPFTDEVDLIESMVPPERRVVLRRADANAHEFRKQRLQDFAILHLSTHALIDDRIPELSRVALSVVDRTGHTVDGFLRPYQMGELRLNGSIVVLSACDTALGKEVSGEGLMGFTSSLFYAGAAQLVLTLANVEAEASSEFLKAMYSALLSPEAPSIEHALTLARREMEASKRWKDPYHWASFMVTGRPTR
jgi:tetratricopeptide (TPR) repeat protein